MPVPVDKTIMKEKKEDNPDESPSYQLNVSDNATFINRVDSIFGSLTSLEEQHTEAVRNYEAIAVEEEKSAEVVDDIDDGQGCSSSGGGDCDKGEEKKPVVDLRNKLNKERNKRRTPDFVANPSKWKKYSLEEDGTAQFSKNLSADQLNSAVALDFMKQLKNPKDSSEEEEMETDQKASSDNSFVFKVPDLPNKSTDSTETTAVCKTTGSAGARVMETFQFGQKSTAKKPKVKHIDSNNSSNEEKKSSDIVSLDLLHPCGEEDENVEDCTDDSKKHDEQEVVAVFMSRGKKKNRCIRKKTCEDEDDDE